MSILLVLLTAVAIATAVVLGVVAIKQQSTLRDQAENLAYYSRTYLTLNGASAESGSYLLLSTDGGQHWYNTVRNDNDKGFHIVDEADPDKVSAILGLRRMFDHVRTHGPLDPTNEGDVEILTDAGFTVTAA